MHELLTETVSVNYRKGLDTLPRRPRDVKSWEEDSFYAGRRQLFRAFSALLICLVEIVRLLSLTGFRISSRAEATCTLGTIETGLDCFLRP